MKRLYRSETNQQVAGVCAGLSEYLNVDVTLVRLMFVIMSLLGGPGLVAYIALWWVMPTESEVLDNAISEKRKNDE